MQYKKSTEERFRDVFFLLRMAGIPINVGNVSKLRFVYNVVVTTCSYFLFFTTTLELILGKSDLKYFMKSFREFIMIGMHIWMDINLRLNLKDLNKLFWLTESFTYENLPIRDSETGSLTMAGLLPRLQYIMKNFSLGSLCIHLIQCTIRIFTSRELMFNAWFYYDIAATPTYEIMQVIQIISTLRLMGLTFGPPYLYASLSCIACTQLEKIRGLLSEIKPRNSILDSKMAAGEQSGIQEQLNNCIRLHQATIGYLRLLENTMSTLLCGTFLFLLTGQCGAAFALVINLGHYVDLSQALLNYLILLGFVFSYCSIGTIVTEKYESVRDAAWASDWVGTPLPYQRCILFIIAKSNEEFTLTAGKFVPVSNVTMMSMINQSLSFFMFLLTMKDKNEANA